MSQTIKRTKEEIELAQKRGKEVSELKKTADDLLFSYLDKKRKADLLEKELQIIRDDIRKMYKDHSVIRNYETKTKLKIKKSKYGKKELTDEQIKNRQKKNLKRKAKTQEKKEKMQTDKEEKEKIVKKRKLSNLEREANIRKAFEGSRSEYVPRTPRWEGEGLL